MSRASDLAKKLLAGLLSVSIVFSGPLHAALTDIADYPITQPATASLNPNLLLILDDSGSMARQFSPDYVSPHVESAVRTRNCFDSYDTNNDITTTLEHCGPGDPPAMAPEFNAQYYNPEIRYLPAVNYDGSQRANMTCANTGGTLQNPGDDPNDPNAPCVGGGGWTAVPTDNVSAPGREPGAQGPHHGPGRSRAATGTPASSPVIYDLQRPAELAGPSLVQDSGRHEFQRSQPLPYEQRVHLSELRVRLRQGSPRGTSSTGSARPTTTGSSRPSIARTRALTNCVASDGPTVVGGVSYSVPAPVRFCADATLTDCQRQAFQHAPVPEVRGPHRSRPAALRPLRACARITVADPQPDSAQGQRG
ncbi:MAG: hypothetical protein RML56_13990 [Burkholderiales bacterium]|nr:hypothetical protein [Burkholderiales bacterium]